MNSSIDFIKFFIENWDKVQTISSTTWIKIRELFTTGDKSIGFIKRKLKFIDYYKVSQKTILKKYSRFIIPTEYRGYLLESVFISLLYRDGKNREADKKRIELNSVDPKALRIYNLYNSNVIIIVFLKIEEMLKEGKNEQEITGTASKMLDDLINDKAIIYVNNFDDMEQIYDEIKKQLNIKKYSLIIGSGEDNTQKIVQILAKTVNDPYFRDFEIKHSTETIGNKEHYRVFIYEKISIHESDK